MNNDDIKIESILKRYKPSGAPAGLKGRIFQSKEKRWKRTWLAVAAGILLAAGAGLIWQILSKPANSKMNDIRLAQIEQAVTRAGQASQLLAVADLFAGQPGGKEHAKEIYGEVTNLFPDLNAGIQAQLRLKSY
jgi:hypothetical protein